MTTPNLVQGFSERIWNAGDVDAASDLLVHDFVFRGSLGTELHGREAFSEYVRSVRRALADCRCEVIECVAEEDRAFAKMRFCGTHVGTFRGYPPTGKPVQWTGAALFRFDGRAIADVWMLGNLAGLDAVLRQNHAGE